MPSSDSMAGAAPLHGLSAPVAFSTVIWTEIPQLPGVYVIYEGEEAIYVGMSGRNGKGNLRSRLRDHRSGQMVNMFAKSYHVLKHENNRNVANLGLSLFFQQFCTRHLAPGHRARLVVARGAAAGCGTTD